MSDLYDYYLECSGPPLPDGYSFKIETNEDWPNELGFSIIGPPSGWRKKRYEQRFTDDYLGPFIYGSTKWYRVDRKTNRSGDTPEDRLIHILRLLYAEWRDYSYEQDIIERWNSYIGVHP